MKEILHKHKPIIQSELSGTENRKNVIKILSGLSYNTYILSNKDLVKPGVQDINDYTGDFYFLF